jgi:hypothetical protein
MPATLTLVFYTPLHMLCVFNPPPAPLTYQVDATEGHKAGCPHPPSTNAQGSQPKPSSEALQALAEAMCGTAASAAVQAPAATAPSAGGATVACNELQEVGGVSWEIWGDAKARWSSHGRRCTNCWCRTLCSTYVPSAAVTVSKQTAQ